MIACGNGNLRCKLPGGSKPPPYKMNGAINPNLAYEKPRERKLPGVIFQMGVKTNFWIRPSQVA